MRPICAITGCHAAPHGGTRDHRLVACRGRRRQAAPGAVRCHQSTSGCGAPRVAGPSLATPTILLPSDRLPRGLYDTSRRVGLCPAFGSTFLNPGFARPLSVCRSSMTAKTNTATTRRTAARTNTPRGDVHDAPSSRHRQCLVRCHDRHTAASPRDRSGPTAVRRDRKRLTSRQASHQAGPRGQPRRHPGTHKAFRVV